MKQQKILILGADGFIGSNLAKSLHKERTFKIYAFDLFKDGVSRNIDAFDDNLVMVQGNFLNRDDLKRAVADMDYVFHLISLTTPGSSMNDPLIDVDANIKGTIALLDECSNANVKKVIFSSSGGAIYGNTQKKLLSEDDSTNPISPYAISKLTIEKYLEYYRINRGLEYLILRYANPYGPGQNVVGSQGIIPIFLNLIKQGKPITIFGDGNNIRDYIYVDDLVDITKLLFTKKTKYTIYNIGNGLGVSINEIVNIMQDIIGKKIIISRKPGRHVDVRSIVLNMSRTMNEIGDISITNLKDGIGKTWEHLRGN